MKAEKIIRKIIYAIDKSMNTAVLIVIVFLLAFAVYALWDSQQVYRAADSNVYAAYKPTVDGAGLSFEELMAINPEVFAWLSIEGTNIDYPVVQGENNMKYVNTNAEGEYSLSGAIFLDFNNSKGFTDFNSIIYGHHMAKKMMFGEIGEFADKAMFDTHRYGTLYFDKQAHELEFFAFLHVDAYDGRVFSPAVTDAARGEYLDNLLRLATYTRDIGVTVDDNIVLLSTCSASSTNGRDILVGRLKKAEEDI